MSVPISLYAAYFCVSCEHFYEGGIESTCQKCGASTIIPATAWIPSMAELEETPERAAAIRRHLIRAQLQQWQAKPEGMPS